MLLRAAPVAGSLGARPIPTATFAELGLYWARHGAARLYPGGVSSNTSPRGLLCRSTLRPGETPDQALSRRLRESQQVEERVKDVYTEEDLERELQAAGDNLVVLEVQSETLCETGLAEEPELHWDLDKKEAEAARLAQCAAVKHVFQRTARECRDVQFLSIHADSDEASALCDKLGIDMLPTLQFYRKGRKLWEHKGVMQAEQDLGEGVLYYGNTAGKGVRGSDFVKELHTRQDFEKFVAEQEPNVLTVVNVALESAQPCIRIFPAVLALAKNFVGHAAFARLMGDGQGGSPEEVKQVQQLMRDYNVIEVPTFLFFRNGKPVGRHVGSSRGDLIGQILQQQAAAGIAPPPPPPGAGTQRRKAAARVAPARKASAW